MSSRPGAPGASAGGHSLRDVLAAGMATEMDAGPNRKRACEAPSDNALERYAVTIAHAYIRQPHPVESDDHPYDRPDDQSFVQPQFPTPTLELEYIRYPKDGQAELDAICHAAARDMLTEDGLYERLWRQVVQKMEDKSPANMDICDVQEVANDAYGFKALLCMNNALTESQDQPPYIHWQDTQWYGLTGVDARVFGLCHQLRNLVQGLMKGEWHHDGEKPDIKSYVRWVAQMCDPRDPPTRQVSAAQRVSF